MKIQESLEGKHFFFFFLQPLNITATAEASGSRHLSKVPLFPSAETARAHAHAHMHPQIRRQADMARSN